MKRRLEPVRAARRGSRLFALALFGAIGACAGEPSPRVAEPASFAADLAQAAATIRPEELFGHISTLASDEFEGRAPGTRGEELSVAYLSEQFKVLGLAPGNPDGTYVQAVPLVGLRAEPKASITTPKGVLVPAFPKDAVALTRRLQPEVRVEGSPIVFVGYGVDAPEYGWNDFAGLDVRGKTIVMLVNDPPVRDPARPDELDERMFKGRAMTYYGRWTYKYEVASAKGAAAALIVHETGPAGYPWEVVGGSWGRENFDLESADGNASRVGVEGWITDAFARELFTACGQDFDAAKKAAAVRGFEPIALDARADLSIANTIRHVASKNVVARLPGSDPALAGEHVIYTAHWDHLGRDPAREGDPIFNGAVDNASGCAALLEIAGAYTALAHRPPRSILFLAVTAEEKGLLGSRYYAAHPLWPLEKALCGINMDGLNCWGRTRDVVNVSLGHSTLDELLAEVAGRQGRTVVPDAEPEKGYFFRSDHFELAKRGVPALDADSGLEFVGQPKDFGLRTRERYTKEDYHKPSDEVKPDWDLSGAAEDAAMLFEVGLRVARGEHRPRWKPASEFASLRPGARE
jgi:Zn-dependent M28 family amino/carboxypeptidase